MDNKVIKVLKELDRRKKKRRIQRNLRDGSNPFDLSEEVFRKLYRLSRDAARQVFSEIQNQLQTGQRSTAVPAIVKFFTAMHFFVHGNYQKSVGNDGNNKMSQAAVSRALHDVVDVMYNVLAEKYIKFPNNLAENVNVKDGFHKKFNFPGIVGCIDCTNIAIFPPPAGHALYPGRVFVNKKRFHSINCQIICDSDLKIIAMNARYPGSVHDRAIWMMSNIKKHMVERYRNGDETSWLLGDSEYSLEPILLTPIVGANPDSPEGCYTKTQCLVQHSVKKCIGMLKANFCCLRNDKALHYSPPFASKIIYSCAIFHNIMRIWNVEDQDLEVDNEDEDIDNSGHEEDPTDSWLQEGHIVRNNLIQQMFN